MVKVPNPPPSRSDELGVQKRSESPKPPNAVKPQRPPLPPKPTNPLNPPGRGN